MKFRGCDRATTYFRSLKYFVMKRNMGTIDRVVRILIAAVAVYLYVTNVISGAWGIVSIVVAGIFLLTSFVGICPLYLPFGLNTIRKRITHNP